jgi:hypothetical protein
VLKVSFNVNDVSPWREGGTPLEYASAKEHFLDSVKAIAIKASEEFGRQLAGAYTRSR